MPFGKPQLLKDITPGTASTNFGSIGSTDESVYFTVNKPDNTYDIWKSDGTNTGTKLLKSMGGFEPNFNFYSSNAPQIYFTASKNNGDLERQNTWQLWKTNGTATGTTLVKDLGKWDTFYADTPSWNGKTYFTSAKYNTTTKTNNYELWSTDGTTTGTKLVKSLGLNEIDGIYSWFDDDKNLYFRTFKDDGNWETPDTYQLWKTNGTATGTTLVKDLGKWDGYYSGDISDWNGKKYFTSAKYNTTTKTNNYELWSTDGTTTGTKLVKNLGLNQANSIYSWLDDKNLYFTTVKDDGNWEIPDTYQLWKTNGTATGTTLVKDLGKWDGYYSGDVESWNGKTYFTSAKYNTTTKTNNYELWSTDGTTTGTKLVKSFGINQPDYINSWLDDKNLYFTTVKDDGDYSTPDNYQLWITNGTATGTTLVKDLGKWDNYYHIDLVNDKINFTIAKYNTTTKTNNYELWSTDGTSAGTKLVKSFGEYSPGGSIGNFGTQKVFKVVKDDGNYETPDPYQLWKTDGTPIGTQLVQNLGKQEQYSSDAFLGSDYYYQAMTGTNGNELWKLPFTEPTTTIRSAIEPTRESNYDVLLQGGLAEKIISLADQSDVVLPPELQPNHLHNLLGKAINNLSSGDFNNQMALDELRTKLSQVQELLPLNLQDSIF